MSTVAAMPRMLFSYRVRPDGTACMPYASADVEEIFGVAPQDVTASPESFFQRMHPDDVERVREGLDSMARALSRWSDVFRVRHPTRGDLWVQGRCIPARETDGSILCGGFIAEITPDVATEKQSLPDEFQYRELFDHMSEGFCYCKMLFENGEGRDFIYLAVNRSFEVLTGLKNVVGKRASEAVPGFQESDPEVFEICTRVALSGIPEKFEIFVHAVDEWFSVSMYSPQKGHFVALFDLITERKRTEQSLRTRDQEIQALLDNAPDLIVRVDREGRYLYTNAVIQRVSGHAPEQVLGKTSKEAGVPDDLCELFSRMRQKVLETGRPITFEFTYPAPGGDKVLEDRFLPEFGEDGSVQSMLAVARDITEKKRLEKVAEEAHEQIRALAASLLAAQDEERRRFSQELHEGLCQRLASLAIDIRNLLVEVPESARERLEALQRRVIEAADATHHLAYSLHPSVLDDLGLVVALQSLCDDFSQRAKLEITFSHGDSLDALAPEVASSFYWVAREALQNIVWHAGAEHAWVTLAESDGSLVLNVEDDGAGFDVVAAKGKGRLGLISMNERARLVHGTLSIHSTPDLGTQVVVEVPLHAESL
jgi:PAS domain S-box-containing protein